MLLLVFPAALLAAHALSRLAQSRRLAAAALACLLVAGELNLGGSFNLDRWEEGRFLAGTPPPPLGCKSFYLSAPRPIGGVSASHEQINLSVDAMLLAETFHVPTFNGHASFFPPGFRLGFDEPAAYAMAVRASVAGQEPPRASCALDPRTAQWSPASSSPAPMSYGRWTSLGSGGGQAYLLGGWSAAQPEGRWTEGRDAGLVMGIGQPGGDVALTLQAVPFAGRGGFSPVEVFANGVLVATWRPAPSSQDLLATIPRRLIGVDGALRIRFSIISPMRPADVTPHSRDVRELGLFAQQLRLDMVGKSTGG